MMARFSGFNYEDDEQVQHTRTAWREWIAEVRTRRSATVRLVDGETRVYCRALGAAPQLVAEIYATPSQLGVRHD